MHGIQNKLWIPFQLSRGGIPISHLFFTDDLILYAKANANQASLIDHILAEFGLYSGHRPCRYLPNLFSLQADEWLFNNLKLNRLHSCTHIPWRILFASLVWQLWKLRNSILFANTDMTNAALQRLSYSWASHFISSSPASASPTPPVRELVQ
ncbi:hypothetical protein V6N12_008677 [Hibiscus sabdariffa]|uniref:Reverse transcriptase domain-containing protein n=1 Tax=Hibiscus sabdariffa TaxID=183260 RepID=A0ABR2AS01_9ROSI